MAESEFKKGDRVAYDENTGAVERSNLVQVAWDNGHVGVADASDLLPAPVKRFVLERRAHGVARLKFPESENHCCDGEVLSRDDMLAIRDKLNKVLGDG